ncbi:DeoR/GlpR family DNA-binding transcription regulator [Paenibacillus sp.]|uniref:DeoR/GlpR family DNA-binding transcription regulator n=1 Tax=Paenibacillus sp. TaxID=58172 RepID=UPI002D22E58F|nr:DeoR/GlpR family DNA-binding transcription regulator [Paenibacillus sp.]HZG56721.1 DeoR/GlpR family DNA-binding transcription regulator [Paenibacillus sp.]
MSPPSPQEPLFAEERKSGIVELVNRRKKALVPELVRHFQVSPATIRNDLRELEQLGLLRRTHGGAIPVDLARVGFESEHENKSVEKKDRKQAIALKALERVEDGDIVLLDAGTTTLELAKLLGRRKDVTVVVNDLDIAIHLENVEGLNVILIGGTLRRHFHCTVGTFATSLLSELNVDKLFLGTNSFSVVKGCTTPDISQAEVKRLMIRVTSEVILLCDSSKFGKTSFVQFAPLSDIDAVITDAAVDARDVDELTAQGIDVYAVEFGVRP